MHDDEKWVWLWVIMYELYEFDWDVGEMWIHDIEVHVEMYMIL